MPEFSTTDGFALSELEGILREVINSDGEFELYPKGTSMLPLIKEGRDAVILTRPKHRLDRDDIALYKRLDGHYVLHRVIAENDDGTYTMCGDNQIIPEPGITDEQIIAVVKYLKIDGKTVNLTDRKYLGYVARRRSLKLRRILLKFEHFIY